MDAERSLVLATRERARREREEDQRRRDREAQRLRNELGYMVEPDSVLAFDVSQYDDFGVFNTIAPTEPLDRTSSDVSDG